MKKIVNSNRGYRKLSVLVMFSLVLLVTYLSVVDAIGITPGRTTVNFEPGLSKEISFSIINSENKDMSVVFMVRGNLSDYITLSKTYGELTKEEDSKSFTYKVDLPDKIEKPGLYEVEIVALEAPKDLKEQGSFVGATVAVISQLHIYVPYPDKYVDAALNVVESDGKELFLIPVINRGKLDIVDIKATIDIYSGTDEKIVTLETNSLSLPSLDRKELAAEWTPNVNPGRYKAVVTVRYDDEITSIFKEFNIGEMFLEILEVNINDFELGGIAKFETLVENKWSSGFTDIFLNILVYNHEGEVMADFESQAYDVDGLSQLEMIAYWDTAGVHEGTYEGKLILNYGEKSTDRNVEMKISEDSLEVIGLTGRVIVKSREPFNLNNILIILVIFLIIVNIVWFAVVKRMLKKK